MSSFSTTSSESRTLKFVAGAYYIPKQNTKSPLGEDAYFISHSRQSIGVADGVGGWAERGIDAGIFARELMLNAERKINSYPLGVPSNTMNVLRFAYLNTRSKGSSTACIVTLSDNCLHAVNIGDSGFLVIRNGVTVFHSPAQQFKFDCPYQLDKSGDGMDLAQKISVSVTLDDIVILGTDGLFDNVYDTEIEEIVKKCIDNDSKPEQTARNIAEVACRKSKEKDIFTPYSEAAMAAGKNMPGGKYDDITVVAAYVGFPDLESE